MEAFKLGSPGKLMAIISKLLVDVVNESPRPFMKNQPAIIAQHYPRAWGLILWKKISAGPRHPARRKSDVLRRPAKRPSKPKKALDELRNVLQGKM